MRRFKSGWCFGLAVSWSIPAMGLLANCSNPSHPGTSFASRFSKRIDTAATVKPFSSFSTMRTLLTGSHGAWMLAATPTQRGAALELVRPSIQQSEAQQRVAIFVTEFPAGEFQPGDLDGALAYLFKGDPASIPPPPGFKGFRVFLPPEGKGHCGLMKRSDTSLIYLQVEAPEAGNQHECRVENLMADSTLETNDPQLEGSRHRFLALLVNTLGLKALEDSSLKVAQRDFQQAFALDSLTPEYLANQAAIFDLRRDAAGGVALLAQHRALLKSSGQLCGILGSFYEDLNQFEEARDWALQALEKEPANREWLINLSDALWGLGEKVQSKNVLLRPYAEKPDFRLAVYLAATHLGLEEYENALSVLEKAQADSAPTAKSAAYTVRALIGLKRYEEGLDFIHKQPAEISTTPENLFLQAACEFHLKLYRQALASVRQSLRAGMADREAQELQTQIAALLGDRSNQLLRSPLAPLRTTLTIDQVKKQLRDSSWDVRLANHPISLLNQQIAYQWTPKGRWKQTRRQFFLIPEGNRLIKFSELRFDLNTSFERLYINRVQCYDSAWKPVYTGKMEDYYLTKNLDAALHPENLLVHLGLKTRPGKMFVEIMITQEAQVPSAEFPFIRFEHNAGYPVVFSRFDILSPPKNLLFTTYGDVHIDTLSDKLSFIMDTPAYPAEARFAPDAEDYASGFTTSAFTTWREVGLRYLQDLRRAGIDLGNVALPVRERAAELLGPYPAANPVYPLFRFVRDSIRYENFEFSLNASIPDSTVNVLAKGQGDCKGHALLLTQLLQARGVEADLCLVNLYRQGEVGQPHINQFNHMIVYVPRQKGFGPYFLDPTEKTSSFRRVPLDLEGRNTLILEPSNPRLATIPEIDSAGEHVVRIFHDLSVDRDQIARGCDSLVLNGKAASEFREHLATWNPASKHQNLLSWLASSYSAFNEDSFRILGEDDPDLPLVLVLRYHSRFPYLHAEHSFDYFPKLELSFLRFPEAEGRHIPVSFPHEVTVESIWTYNLPRGFQWKSLSLARELDEEYLRWRFSIQQNNPETIVLRQEWRIDPFLAEPDEYRQLREQWDPLLQRCGLRLAISKL